MLDKIKGQKMLINNLFYVYFSFPLVFSHINREMGPLIFFFTCDKIILKRNINMKWFYYLNQLKFINFFIIFVFIFFFNQGRWKLIENANPSDPIKWIWVDFYRISFLYKKFFVAAIGLLVDVCHDMCNPFVQW